MSENLQNLNLTYPTGVGPDSGFDPSRTIQLLGCNRATSSRADALHFLVIHFPFDAVDSVLLRTVQST